MTGKNSIEHRRQGRLFSGESLRCVAMPLGGIGTGQVAICGDGSLRQWQIFNQVNHAAVLPGSFFAIHAEPADGKAVAVALQTDVFYESPFQPVPCVSDHEIPLWCRELAQVAPTVDDIRFRGEYPLALLEYVCASLPVYVELCAFSPLAPLDSELSGLPLACFAFEVRNQQDKLVRGTLAAFIQNAVGYDGRGPIVGVSHPLFGGNVNTAVKSDKLFGLNMHKHGLLPDHPTFGSMTLATDWDDCAVCLAWTDLRGVWTEFASRGELPDAVTSSLSPQGATHNAALAARFSLAPGESCQIVFVLAWHFPNRVVNWSQEHFGISKTDKPLYIGNHYARRFQSSLEVAKFYFRERERLDSETRKFHGAFFESTLDEEILSATSSQISTIRSPTCFRTAGGKFFGFEGCCGASTSHHAEPASGCCPLNCTHVWNYEHTLGKLFPDLERTMRETDMFSQQHENGGIPHRTALPLDLPRWHSDDATSEVYACDGHFGSILKVYREYQYSGSGEFLQKMWPRVKLATEYAFERWDPDGDGVCEGPQWNTYDLNFYGANSFIGTFYLAALRAAQEMALASNDEKFAEECRRLFKAGRQNLTQRCWNGEYFQQDYDQAQAPTMQYGAGCLSDQLIGQWWAHTLQLGYILDPDMVRSALRAVLKYNFCEDLRGFTQQPRIFASEDEAGLLTCTWPRGGRPEKPMNYCDEVWTGVEYQVAAHLIMEGLVDEGFELVRRARDRYDGRRRNPFNEVECGDHYVRPMSSWTVFEALGGMHWNGVTRTLALRPRVRGDFGAFFAAHDGWGEFQISGEPWESLNVRLLSGSLELKALRLPARPEPVKVRLDGMSVEASVDEEEGGMVARFPKTVRLGEAGRLDLT